MSRVIFDPTPPPAADRELDAFTLTDWSILLSLAGIWGSSFLFIAIGLEHFTPFQIGFLRIALGTAALAMFPGARKAIARRDRGRVALLGIVWMGVPFMLFPVAQQTINSSLAGMINGGVPLWAAFISVLIARKLPPRGVLVGLAAGFSGIVILSLPTLEVGGDQLFGAALVLLATIMYGVALNMAVPLQRKYGSLPVTFWAQMTAAAFTLPFATAGIPQMTYGLDAILAVLALGVFGTGIALTLMVTLSGRVGAARGSIAIYLVPIVAIALGAIFRAEAIHVLSIIGTALVIIGAAITSRSQRAA